MDELLAILGGSWQPLLLYPGLLTGLLVTALFGSIWQWRNRHAMSTLLPHWTPGAVPQAACVLLLLALLPFPRTYWAYPIDLFSALLLLEAPHWLRLARLFHAPDNTLRLAAAREAGAILNVYPLLALALATLGLASGSLLLPSLKGGTPALHWTGIIAWAICLPPLLALGPWYNPETDGWLLALRRVGHIALLISLALPIGAAWGYSASIIAAAASFGSLMALHFLWRGQPEPWERLQPFIALALLVLLLFWDMEVWIMRRR